MQTQRAHEPTSPRAHERTLAREERERASVASYRQRQQTLHDQMLAALADFRHDLIEGYTDSQVAFKHTQAHLAYLRLTAMAPGATSLKAGDALERYWALRGRSVNERSHDVMVADATLYEYVSSLSAHLYATDENEQAEPAQ